IPDAMRKPRPPTPGLWLDKTGYNLASAIETTRECDPAVIDRIARYLSVIAEPVELLGTEIHSEFETVHFRLGRGSQGTPLDFTARNMSDGTLRALAALVAAFQIVLPSGHPTVVGIEEPETALHPGAMRGLVD